MKTTILLAIIVSLVLFAGCVAQDNTSGTAGTGGTGSGTGNTGGTGGNTGTAAGGTTNGGAATDGGTGGAGTDGGTNNGGNGGSDFGSLFSNIQNPEYKATYQVTGAQSMEYTLYMKGDKMRMDTMVESVVSEIFFMNGKTYTCMKIMESAPFTCYESGATDDTKPQTADDLKNSQDENTLTMLPDRTIAGQTGKCFKLTEKSGGATSEHCITTDGIVLYQSFSGMTMTATSVQRGVGDDAFTLPAQPTSMPG